MKTFFTIMLIGLNSGNEHGTAPEEKPKNQESKGAALALESEAIDLRALLVKAVQIKATNTNSTAGDDSGTFEHRNGRNLLTNARKFSILIDMDVREGSPGASVDTPGVGPEMLLVSL